MLSFDDLRGGFRDFYYTIEHCTAEWKPSAIPQIQYLKGFPGERLRDYQGSFNTYKEYTNYWLEFPNFAIEPLVSGHYRSAERRVGKDCVSTCRSRWSPYH